jgi:hypothetical protein
MNNRHASSKLSKLELNLNRAVFVIFISLITLVSFSVGAIYMLKLQHFSSFPYVYPNNSGDGSVLPLYVEQW